MNIQAIILRTLKAQTELPCAAIEQVAEQIVLQLQAEASQVPVSAYRNREWPNLVTTDGWIYKDPIKLYADPLTALLQGQKP